MSSSDKRSCSCCSESEPAISIWLIIIILLFILLLCGILKGIIGLLFLPWVGMYGLCLLIDLPRPLKRYQEPCIYHRTVVYDEGGYPIHPDTCERNVKMLTKQTEFFLNVIFFIAYPIALIMKICEFVCCITDASAGDENCECYKKVNVIQMMNGCIYGSRKKATGAAAVDMYQEGDGKEEKDTQYVVEMLKASESSLKESFCGLHQ